MNPENQESNLETSPKIDKKDCEKSNLESTLRLSPEINTQTDLEPKSQLDLENNDQDFVYNTLPMLSTELPNSSLYINPLAKRLLIFEILCTLLFITITFLAIDKYWPVEVDKQRANTKQEILNLIETKYKGNIPSAEDQSKGELAGLVSSLKDPYSEFIPKDKINDFKNGLNEKYSGIGVRFNRVGKEVFVTQVFAGGPASIGGREVGYVLLKVENKEVKNLSNNELGESIRGEEGTQVNITVVRSDLEKSYKITRKNIQSEVVSLEVRGEIGIISISTFSENSAEKMAKVAAQVVANTSIKKLVLDLRSNSGGLLDQSILIASYFMPEKSLFVKEAYKSQVKEERTVKVENSLEKYSVIIVTDQGTASASEILAAALKDNRQIKLVGQKTYGKGVVQQLSTLKSGDLIKITIAEWYTPKGEKINGKGIQPDISVDLDKNSLDRAVDEISK